MKHIILFSILFYFSTLQAQDNTYVIGTTTYEINGTYRTTGKPKVVRSEKNKRQFLINMGYEKLPDGYEVDHIIPLSEGGSDDPSNMQILTIEEHKRKTSRERSNNSNSTRIKSSSLNSTSSYPEFKTIYNSNSNTTPTCGALTSKGTFCKRKVKDGGRCASHR